MTFLIFLGCVIGYLALGAAYVRTQAVAIDRRVEYHHSRDKETRRAIGIRVLGWPVMMFVDFVRGPAYAWTTSPIRARLTCPGADDAGPLITVPG
ncbi:MAG TPA: hypothetical protein VFE65_09185 [Pseudonocardia sp.]|nr:hypothetical protein [Pseudonocardia sp.]